MRLAVYFDLIYGVHMLFGVIGKFGALVTVIHAQPGAIVARARYGLVVFH